ncbi:hypothetical protein [Paludisphaera rhizosphaerae]|uniref:hypothetical protein n=1 Tax=Paludisphaera rhizosphaerae TaxID=2711216 RepID=UPI0013EE2B46|nr:hypothetical protein [Paludisphaera rhizosphaerae]
MTFTQILSTLGVVGGAARSWGPKLAAAAALISVGFGLSEYRSKPAEPAAVVSIRATGRTYPKTLATAYAAAWIKGAEALEAGKGPVDALGVVTEAWTAGRVALFDKAVAPAFAAVVPEGKADAEVSAADRAALAALWRAFAAGLSGSK